MKSIDLLRALGNVDDVHIDDTPIEAVIKPQKHPVWIKWTAVAACLALTAVSLGIYLHRDAASTRPPLLSEASQTTTFAATTSPTSVTLTTTTPTDPALPASIVYPADNTPCEQNTGLDCWTTEIYYDYAELAELVDIVIVADVVENYHEIVSINNFRLYAKVAVQDVIKGDVKTGDTLYVDDNGLAYRDPEGNFGPVHTACGGPLLETGNRVLLFLMTPESAPNTYRITSDGINLHWFAEGGSIGKFFYDTDGNYHASFLYNEDFPDNYATGVMLEDYEPKTLGEIKEQIAAAGEK